MKKFIQLVLIIILVLSLAACGKTEISQNSSSIVTTSKSTGEVYKDGTLTYTNLVGEQVQQEVRDTLISSGVSKDSIEKLFIWVNDFNQCMKDCESFNLVDTWTTSTIPAVDYGEYSPMSNMWYKHNKRNFSDVLCRIAAFQLTQGNIAVKNLIDKDKWECYTDTQWLYSDWDAISGFSLIDLDETETSRYFTLYNPVSITPDCSSDEMYKSIKSDWSDRKISFTESKVSLITIWIQYQSQTAAAHAATLIQCDNEYMLFEKSNPQSPYQATKFSNIGQVKQYMYETIHLDDVRYGVQTGTYIVMQNDKIL